MKTFQITKEQISKIYACSNSGWLNEKLKEWWPEAFNTELQVGNWYKSKSNNIAFYQGEGVLTFGINELRGWIESPNWFNEFNITKHNCRPATKDEVRTALIAEAKRRGIKSGSCLKTPKNFGNGKFSDGLFLKRDSEFEFDWNDLRIRSATIEGSAAVIFKDGVWAEIIQEKEVTMEEISEKFGVPLLGLKIVNNSKS
ncbi:hypothetical protein [Chryseobacterium defluvii]|uniref:Uncharacterized protein n=1 Tax=Chryseobacterium defluvii TaxID=160396 RepID=A0A495SLE7_9FLAO|nr:hypothetical protein [Chryseobacterium defluvii]RKT01058.1 hypothetical protein BCF58_0269 [Chryseobacterium defluvii]